MIDDFFDINKLTKVKKTIQKLKKNEEKDIAIIGIFSKIGPTNSCEEYWKTLKNGESLIRDFPESRLKDSMDILSKPIVKEKLIRAAYLNDIDKFDYEFFNLSLREARMMDPNQRIFLQASWNVLEEAGYGGDNIKGTKTGVFVGHSNDLRIDYPAYIYAKNKEKYKDISLPGNVRSIIASRIAYILDLKGPAMVIDTACSSALVAIHLACQSLKNGGCDMAIAGGVKINILPIERGLDDDTGIRSKSDIVRTFDNDADGIASGEGVCTLLLKPLEKAVIDGDNIRGVIKGSAINQDGNSIGITAPNDEAQKDVILETWKKANINPETISHIESHGTGTKLGDPVEVSGITKAFNCYTNKKNFCSIGSNKPNVGHLDSISAMSSIIKVLLMFKHRQIPPLINFNRPNSRINFVDSPLYINDKCIKWEPEGEKLISGISSFGLSGTNSHIIMEEYKRENINIFQKNSKKYIFTLSASYKKILKELAIMYVKTIEDGTNCLNIGDICYTVNIGREHNQYRLACLVSSVNELKEKLELYIKENESRENEYFYGYHKIISSRKNNLESFEIDEEKKQCINEESEELIGNICNNEKDDDKLNKLCKLYVRGASIKWNKYYFNEHRKKVSLPVYPFKKERCWIEEDSDKSRLSYLLNGMKISSIGQTIYSSKFSPKNNWVIGDHIVYKKYVMPGTAYIEMVVEAVKSMGFTGKIEIKNLVFINQFAMDYEEEKEIQIILKEKDDKYDFTIASYNEEENDWEIHAEGLAVNLKENQLKINMKNIASIIENNQLVDFDYSDTLVSLGSRWNAINKKVYKKSDGYLAYIQLDEEYKKDLESCYFHPALMDRGINASIDIISRDSYYLPLSYSKLKLYDYIGSKFYCSIVEKDQKHNKETVAFDITLFDETGNVLVEAKNYFVKKVRVNIFENKVRKKMLFNIEWDMFNIDNEESESIEGGIAIVRDSNINDFTIINRLEDLGIKSIEVILDEEGMISYKSSGVKKYVSDYFELMDILKFEKIKNIIYISHSKFSENNRSIYNSFSLIKALVSKKMSKELKVLFVSENAYEVSGREDNVNPFNSAVSALYNVISQEYYDLRCRFLDFSKIIQVEIIINNLKKKWTKVILAYRDGKYYEKVLKEIEIKEDKRGSCSLRTDGVYVITGGTGGLALEVAKHISKKKKINIILLSRTQIPERSKWDEIVKNSDEYKVIRLIKTIEYIEKNGIKVVCYSVDVSNKENLKLVMEKIRSDFGRINGVLHCAGIAGDGFLLTKSNEKFNNVILPKVQGTINMDLLTREDNLDFMILFSSINSIIGEQGQGDYSAANAFMDGYCNYRNKIRLRTISINWAAWKDIGMAFEHNSYKNNGLFNSLEIKDALFLLDIILDNQLSNVIVGKINNKFFKDNHKEYVPFRIDNSIIGKMKKETTKDKKINNEKKVVISGEHNEIISQVEKDVARLWAEVLQKNELNIYDSFLSLGGDSILATYLYKKIDGQYPGILDISDIFNYSSIYEMSKCIERKLNKDDKEKKFESEEDSLDNLLNMLANGDISVNDIYEVLG
ncbi:SDR family NAD(P)-dependent oxidoreductase [Clostridium botulinum]|nr:SDR family NAD(P)-dependent oxidoreductase [Clostridium botulinum]